MLNLYQFEQSEKKIANKIFKTVLKEYGIKRKRVTVDITMVAAEEIHRVNLETRQVDKSTDVLSFPALEIADNKFNYDNYLDELSPEDGKLYLGEILICREIMCEQATEYGHSKERECAFLITHGLLHLLGCDHIEEKDKAIMRAKEKVILTKAKFFRE